MMIFFSSPLHIFIDIRRLAKLFLWFKMLSIVINSISNNNVMLYYIFFWFALPILIEIYLDTENSG